MANGTGVFAEVPEEERREQVRQLILSTDDGKTFVHRTSHWRVLWSPAGQGHVLFLESPLAGTTPRVYADNAAVARFLQRTIETLLHKPFADEALPITDAQRHAIFEGNARRVFPRLDAKLKERGL